MEVEGLNAEAEARSITAARSRKVLSGILGFVQANL
jgi:hypothetical protein